jgi:hypothetical protein
MITELTIIIRMSMATDLELHFLLIHCLSVPSHHRRAFMRSCEKDNISGRPSGRKCNDFSIRHEIYWSSHA